MLCFVNSVTGGNEGRKVADTTLETSEAPRRVFERIVLRRGSLRGLGQRCGRSTMWIWRQLRQNKGIDMVKTGKVLDQLGVPVRFFYEEILDQTPEYDPAWLLEHYRENNGIPRDPFLAEVHDRLLGLLDHPSGPGSRRCRTEIDALEEQRNFDRAAAKRSLEALGRVLLERCESEIQNRQPVQRGVVADLTHVFLVWSGVQRTRGHRDDSVDGYRLAYRLAIRCRDQHLQGYFFHLVSNLLLELGQPSHALRFSEQAGAIFQQIRGRDLLAQSLIHTSSALRALGRHDESRYKAVAALRIAPRDATRARVAAWTRLANIALMRNKLRSALGKLSRAKKLVSGPSYIAAFLAWREAAVFAKLGRQTEAAAGFKSAIDLFEKHGQPLDVAFVVVDLAEMLMSSGRFAETLVIARALTPTIEKLSANAQAWALWLDLVALILQGSRDTSLAHVVMLRKALETADPKIRLQLNS